MNINSRIALLTVAVFLCHCNNFNSKRINQQQNFYDRINLDTLKQMGFDAPLVLDPNIELKVKKEFIYNSDCNQLHQYDLHAFLVTDIDLDSLLLAVNNDIVLVGHMYDECNNFIERPMLYKDSDTSCFRDKPVVPPINYADYFTRYPNYKPELVEFIVLKESQGFFFKPNCPNTEKLRSRTGEHGISRGILVHRKNKEAIYYLMVW